VPNPSKRKGSDWEVTVANYLRDNGFPYAERRVTQGSKDRGDIGGIPGVVIECKAEKLITLAEYMDEVAVEKANAHAPVGFAVVKRRNYGVERAYSVMELQHQIELLR
jgi:hypothetical protein